MDDECKNPVPQLHRLRFGTLYAGREGAEMDAGAQL
jgi:hypothetical protein